MYYRWLILEVAIIMTRISKIEIGEGIELPGGIDFLRSSLLVRRG